MALLVADHDARAALHGGAEGGPRAAREEGGGGGHVRLAGLPLRRLYLLILVLFGTFFSSVCCLVLFFSSVPGPDPFSLIYLLLTHYFFSSLPRLAGFSGDASSSASTSTAWRLSSSSRSSRVLVPVISTSESVRNVVRGE